MVLCSSTKFGIIKPWTNIPWHRRFDFDFWQNSKHIYGKLQYNEKAFGELESFPRFPKTMVLYSSTKLGIIKLSATTQSLRRFDCGFWQTSKQIYRKLQYKEKVSRDFQGLPRFGGEMNLYSSTKFGSKKPWISIPWRKRFELVFW